MLKFLILVSIAVALLTALAGVHIVPEGHVGVIYRGGRMLDVLLEPGPHLKIPLLDSSANVMTMLQTDRVTELKCGTLSGTVIVFPSIEVVNKLDASAVLYIVRNYGLNYDLQLIFDRVQHVVNEICSTHSLQDIVISKFSELDEKIAAELSATANELVNGGLKGGEVSGGLKIVAVRVSKPSVPESVRRSFEQKEAETANRALALERARVAEVEARAAAAQREIRSQMELAIQQGEQRQLKIKDEIMVANERAKADAAFYMVQRAAEANKLLHTPEYVQLKTAEYLAQNTKIYFGDKIPTSLFDGGAAAVMEDAKGKGKK